MDDELEPAMPEDEGVPTETPDLAQLEAARLLANDARPRLRSEGFSEAQIRHWAETYVSEEGGSADLRDFLDWIRTRQR